MARTDDLRKLLSEGSPRPWWWEGPEFGGNWVCSGNTGRPGESGAVHPSAEGQPYAVLAGMGENDAKLIVAAVNALPELLAVVEAARRALDFLDSFGGRPVHGEIADLRSKLDRLEEK